MILNINLRTVSYTHLDVYKRQYLYRILSLLMEKRCDPRTRALAELFRRSSGCPQGNIIHNILYRSTTVSQRTKWCVCVIYANHYWYSGHVMDNNPQEYRTKCFILAKFLSCSNILLFETYFLRTYYYYFTFSTVHVF